MSFCPRVLPALAATLLASATLLPATAEACDVRALKTELNSASPHSAGSVYTRLAACNAASAKSLAKATFSRLLPGESANEAAIAAIGAGAGDVVAAWVDGQQSDERARTIKALGKACGEDPAVAGFFVDTHSRLGEQFWSQRWHAGLRTCRTAPIQSLLSQAVSKKWRDSTQFSSVVEIFARNLGAQALPTLERLATSGDAEQALLIVGVFPDAAGVGSMDGTNQEAAKAAAESIVKLAPELDTKSIEQARISLQALDATPQADALASVRYKDSLQANGTLRWGVIAVETATCKNGKTQLGLHSGVAVEPGKRWSDQVEAPIRAAVEANWPLELSAKCKGTQNIEVLVSSAPLKDDAAFAEWKKGEWKALTKRDNDKLREFEGTELQLP